MNLSEYELERLQNIARNESVLKDLGLSADNQTTVRRTVPGGQQRRKQSEPALPIKRSKRVATKTQVLTYSNDVSPLPTPATLPWPHSNHSPRAIAAFCVAQTLHAAASDAELAAALGPERVVEAEAAQPVRTRMTFEWPSWQDRSTPLTAEQRFALTVPDDWIDDLGRFFENEGDSDDNRHKVLRQVRKLASGDGVGCSYRDGLFAEGEKVCMRTDLEALQQVAWDWLPLKSCPAWMKVASGERAHYEALGVEPAASAAAIEEAFRSAEAKREEHAPETWERIAKAHAHMSTHEGENARTARSW
eukprot:432735-Pleurochrysis_carterae.AAC.1